MASPSVIEAVASRCRRASRAVSSALGTCGMLASTGTFANDRRSSNVWKEVSRRSASIAAAVAAPTASSTPAMMSPSRFGAWGRVAGMAGSRIRNWPPCWLCSMLAASWASSYRFNIEE
ncbi:MAG: hypothetical protein E6J77_05110 [Deltaproteobacteria bacterium]|nr:MAG: hypothetical protein E6J77_05110 [Deltaproteobacteria bacterium]